VAPSPGTRVARAALSQVRERDWKEPAPPPVSSPINRGGELLCTPPRMLARWYDEPCGNQENTSSESYRIEFPCGVRTSLRVYPSTPAAFARDDTHAKSKKNHKLSGMTRRLVLNLFARHDTNGARELSFIAATRWRGIRRGCRSCSRSDAAPAPSDGACRPRATLRACRSP
jgi:hypothetical protein